ncbi:sigma-70 family RNA polymerase sigma factor [Roseovarius nitratireducens]|uniref:sigma-70 family RNA polymerase sigma factor n=1 Tax=Roseovarius nitratireducens TaxID=2044597 RepID=UPI00101AE39A|nr:sigma-70 family RNA polymerase sigma factor [Roseovarius nitratireducens]
MKNIDTAGVLTREELEEAIGELSTADWMRLRSAAQLYAVYPVEPDELVQEALCRAIAGSRKCPREVSVVRFVAEAIRSIAHDELQKVEHQRDEVSVHDDAIEDPDSITPREPGPTAEERMISNEQARGMENRLLELFDGDDEAQLIVLGMLTGTEGAELKEVTGLDQTGFNSKRRYVRRKINNAIENGFTL